MIYYKSLSLEGRPSEDPGSRDLKKLEKSFKKVLTNGEEEGIIEKLSDTGDGSDGHRSLKIEQQNFKH